MKTACRLGILSLLFLGISCTRPCCLNVDVIVDVLVKDKSGNNLLNPTTAGYYASDEIKLFDLKNGQKVEVINLSNTLRYGVLEGYNHEKVLRLFGGPNSRSGEATSFVQWRANDEDAIEFTVTSDKNSITCSKVKCNGVVKYDHQSSSSPRLIEIIK